MSSISKNTEQKYRLDGVQGNAPIEWQDVTIEANYEGDIIQPTLTVDNFIFPLESRKAINKWIEDGKNSGVGIFEGMPFELSLFNNTPIQKQFKAFIDFTGYKDFTDDGKVDVSIMKDSSITHFLEQIEGTTFGYLESIGVFSQSNYVDVPYINEKKFNMMELLISAVILYLMVKELAEAIEKLANAVADVTGLSLFVGTGSTALGAALMAVLKAVLIAVYVAVLLAAVIELSNKLMETLLPKVRNHKAIPLFQLLRLVCDHFGYGFFTPILEMRSVHYLPSNPNLDEKTAGGFISVTKGTQSGIPATLDFGYRCDEMFQLCKELFNAKLAIINGVIHLRSINDPFWIQQSTWTLPDVLLNTKEYNTEEMKATRLLTFITDLNDEWTIDNYFGTSFEIKTTPKTIIRKRAVLLKGLDELNFRTSLGNRKDELNALEEFLKKVGGVIDSITDFFGAGTDFADQVKARIGVLKQQQNWHSIPKLLYLNDGKLPVNHRDKWNTKLLYDLYHNEKSFVLNNFGGQKTYYKGVDIPFGYEDFLQLLENPFFVFKGNNDARIIKFTWNMGHDRAIIDFWIREPYTFNLQETYINPK